ncbi:hypothetical protein [Nonomuraea typhae]|uniref:hypothetical protein n=1 Tax=Nonomuraea typhae TaxID=2603600 RepID=UPI0012FB3694|nr:hypothetical protein [Nonomuraea typhae]
MTSNRPFDPRIYGSGDGSRASRYGPEKGFIRSSDWASLGSAQGPAVTSTLNFLYNPTGFSTTYSINPVNSSWDKVLFQDPGNDDGYQIKGKLGQTLAFSLLFDRTYEVWKGDEEGTWNDVRAALAVAGAVETSKADIATPGEIGIMKIRRADVYFGHNGGMVYTGAITSLSVGYTLFSDKMIPFRTAMSISMMLMPLVDPQSGGSPATSRSSSPNPNLVPSDPDSTVLAPGQWGTNDSGGLFDGGGKVTM